MYKIATSNILGAAKHRNITGTCTYSMCQKKLPMNGPFNGPPVSVPFPFNVRSLSFRGPFNVHLLSVPFSSPF